jgi:TonB family protein
MATLRSNRMTVAGALLGALCPLTLAVPAVGFASVNAAQPGRCVGQHSDPAVIHRTLPIVARSTRPQKVVLAVVVSRDGLVQDAAIVQSSGNSRFDAAAISATKATAFAPAARQCVAIDSTFHYALSCGASGALRTAVVPNSSVQLVTSQPRNPAATVQHAE